jgi:Uncharacterised protein family (UPF0175)
VEAWAGGAPSVLKRELAVQFYAREILPKAAARRLAGMDRVAFDDLLGCGEEIEACRLNEPAVSRQGPHTSTSECRRKHSRGPWSDPSPC